MSMGLEDQVDVITAPFFVKFDLPQYVGSHHIIEQDLRRLVGATAVGIADKNYGQDGPAR